ncbi:MAG: hypothetical protein ACI4RO_00060, partial [Candidatus Scatosoma sp.]
MKKNTRKFYLTLFSALCCTSLYAACKTFGSEKRVSLVLEGILTVVDLGETVKFDEYFDYSAVEEYTLTVTDENGQTQDLTGRSFWTPSDPGKYIFEFTVLSGEKKGADSFELTVSVPKLSWEYTLQNEIYDTGDTLVFADFFDAMNIAADSYYDWEMVMDSVTVSGETTEFSPQDTSYVFESDGEHIFAFHIQSEDGQRIGMTQAVRVRYVDKEMLEWMSRNDIEAYNALSLKKDGSVVLAEGIADYSGASVIPNSSKKIDSAYLAYNGNYTFNDFLVVDFTGNNMPTVTMFNEEVTNSFFYNDAATEAQNKGIVFSNGLTYGNGLPVVQWENSVNARYQVMGPWKTKRVDDTVEGWFRATASNSMGMTKLNTTPKARYRLIVGVTEGDSDSFTVAMFLASLDTGEILENAIEKISTSASATVNGEKNEWKCDIPGNYYSGSI